MSINYDSVFEEIYNQLSPRDRAYVGYQHPIDEIAEAYLEAFRELGQVVGIQSDSEYYFFAVANPGWNGRVSSEAIEVHNLLLDLAEDEGWDVEEMEGL